MGKCNCYEERSICIYTNPPRYDHYGVCLGTKEVDRCSCGGDESKCNFYPEKRKAAQKMLSTAEMWLKAQEDGKMYINNDVLYSKVCGFVDVDDLEPWPIECMPSIESIFDWDGWHEYDKPCMTKDEAEEKFGIRIVN